MCENYKALKRSAGRVVGPLRRTLFDIDHDGVGEKEEETSFVDPLEVQSRAARCGTTRGVSFLSQ